MRALENRQLSSELLIRLVLAPVWLLVALHSLESYSQANRDLQEFFQQDVGLSQDQIADIRDGKAVTKVMASRTPDEVFLFGAIYIHATPESYVKLHGNFDRLRKLPGNLALGVFSNPPRLADLEGFGFDKDDIDSLKNCKPGDCSVQMPASSIEELRSFDWSGDDVVDRLNEQLRRKALQLVIDYQRDGNQALGVYNDKNHPTDVSKQFSYMLSYSRALPARLPDFYRYLLSYPKDKPENVQDTFYWAKVKFGLKPTLRIVQLTTMQGKPGDDLACALAEKQLYSSHYFETALDLSFCVRGTDASGNAGFYLIMAMGSEQRGLSGPKGSMVRRVAVERSVSNLQNALTTIRNTLEASH